MKWRNAIRASEQIGVVKFWSNRLSARFRSPSLHFKLLLLFCVATSLLIGDTADGQQLKRIKIGYPSLSFRQSNVWVAREMGLFAKYGLEVEPILFRGGQVATQALVSGDPPIVNIGTVVQATIQGHNLVLTAAVETKYDLIVFTPARDHPAGATQRQAHWHHRVQFGNPLRFDYPCPPPRRRS